ncbi:CYTH and CHAD domain-containing protein [Dermatobacter hominis]|uniref:CYTH and CHAD domain-containing protein n=1 Tax=Dermatobacter hominis TaxID=2884263 RepID=UPI001D113938|nr:CHAD domain-containing protein [Dermatobacter hominis]UDY36117.1 CHAD domain-containing protein [Dermatobacter hominis]
MGTERELKFDLGPGAPVDVDDDVAAAGPARSATLVAEYWDTPSGRLRAWGVTVRHRHASDGSEDGWTVKVPVPADAKGTPGARSRVEIDVPGDPSTPPARVVEVVTGLAAHEHLERVARLTTVRTSTELARPGGRPGHEPGARIDRDEVTVEVDGRTDRFHQLEVESTGDDELLDAIAGWAGDAGLTPSAAANKLEQALGPGRPSAPDPVALRRRSSLHDVLRAAVVGPVRTLVAHDPLLRDDLSRVPTVGAGIAGAAPADQEPWQPEVEVVHHARVATRRLRSDLRSLRPFLDRPRIDHVRAELQWFGRLLGDLRDAQVLRQRLRPWGRTHPFVARLDQQLALHGRRLASAMGGDRYRALVEELLDAASDLPVREGVDTSVRARDALQDRNRWAWRRLRDAATEAGEAPGGTAAADEAVHEVRKAAKRARYLAELSAPVLGHDARRAASRLEDLQDLLGSRQDAVALQRWIERYVTVEGSGLDAPTAFRAGELHMAARLDPARTQDWHPVWDRARKRRPSTW